MASQLKSGSATYGNMYELYVIAAVVVGGTTLSGGEGKMFGTLIGAFTIAVIQNEMNLTNVESYTQKVVLGGVILGAVLLDKIRHGQWLGGLPSPFSSRTFQLKKTSNREKRFQTEWNNGVLEASLTGIQGD